MLNTNVIDVTVLSYRIVEGESKKTGKPFKCIKIDGFYSATGSNYPDSFRGDYLPIQLFENYTDDFKEFYDSKKSVTSFTVEGFFKDFQFNALKILSVKFD